MRTTFFLLVFFGIGCVDGSAPAGTPQESGCSLPRARGPSETCCPDYGADACGAELFCAAFDGRTVPVCYPVGSQAAGKQCTDDSQCQSQSCNRDVGLCRGVPGASCDGSAGCVGSACYKGVCTATKGVLSGICDDTSQCGDSGESCVEGRCGLDNGQRCQRGSNATCSSRFCNAPDLNFGQCAACQSDDDCTTAWGERYERCEAGRCLHTCKDDSHCQGLLACEDAYVGEGCEPYLCDVAAGVCR